VWKYCMNFKKKIDKVITLLVSQDDYKFSASKQMQICTIFTVF